MEMHNIFFFLSACIINPARRAVRHADSTYSHEFSISCDQTQRTWCPTFRSSWSSPLATSFSQGHPREQGLLCKQTLVKTTFSKGNDDTTILHCVHCYFHVEAKLRFLRDHRQKGKTPSLSSQNVSNAYNNSLCLTARVLRHQPNSPETGFLVPFHKDGFLPFFPSTLNLLRHETIFSFALCFMSQSNPSPQKKITRPPLKKLQYIPHSTAHIYKHLTCAPQLQHCTNRYIFSK